MNFTEKTTNQNYIYKGKIINLRVDDILLPNGKSSKREVVEHSGGVGVAALTDEDEIILVEQYRYPYGKVIYEIPAGKREAGEEPAVCGRRELKEETGAECKVLEPLGEIYPTPGYTNEIIHIFWAKGITLGNSNPDENEFVNTVKIPFSKALEMVLSGEISDAKTQIAILKIAAMRKGVKK